MPKSVLTKARLEQAASIAKAHGVTIRLKPDGSATISPMTAKDIEEEELDREFAAFKAKHGYD